MSSQASPLRPRWMKTTRGFVDGWNRLGEQTAFYATILRYIGEAAGKYREETARLTAQMALGSGALALIGGAVVIVSFIIFNISTLIGVVGFSQLGRIGVEALTGFFSAYANPRIVAPLVTAVGLTATIGAGSTAQIGAMRINEEIDALEVIGIRTVSYVASARVLAGVIVVIPMACLAELAAFSATRLAVVVGNGQSSGGYDHYFNTFLRPTDLIWALIQVTLQGITIMLICTYYGYNASGGPVGVGEATGRAVRTSLVAAVFVTMVCALALYGRSGDFHLSG